MIMSWLRCRSTVLLTSLAIFVCSSLAAQNSPPDPAAQFRVAGKVVNKLGGASLARTRIILRNVKDTKDAQSQLTGDDGRFEFRVRAGKYALHGAKRGFISADYNQHEQYSSAIVTGTGVDTENLVLQLAPSAVLSGKVLDESGEPVRRADVTLWREDHLTGVSRIAHFRNSLTDDLGTYEFTPLDAGTYFLSVNSKPWYAVHPATTSSDNAPVQPTVVDRGLDVVYPTTYYAGATESDEATVIPLGGGDRLELDLRLTPVPALHVVFRGPQDPEKGFMMPRLQKRVFDAFDVPRGNEDVRMVSPGVFELTTAPGKYTVRLAGPAQSSRVNDVDLLQDHQVIDISSGEASSNISASVHVLGETTTPRGLFLLLREPQRRGAAFGQVNGKGDVQFPTSLPAPTS